MCWPLAIGAIAGGVLGGIGGKARADASKKPTVTKTVVGPPPAELGGYGRISDALNRVRDLPAYRVGQNNPYMAAMGHVAGRAGIAPPAGGYPNPYMQQMQQQQGQAPPGQQQLMQLPPEVIEMIRQKLMQQFQSPPNSPGGGGGI